MQLPSTSNRFRKRVFHLAFACMLPGLLASLSFQHLSAAEPAGVAGGQLLPDAWLPVWQQPPMADRPLQIVHGIQADQALSGADQVLDPNQKPKQATPLGMAYYKDLGLGGIVCNVDFDQYLQSEEHWQTLVQGIDACEKLGMVVWIYDEHGYPSGSAGGVVLAENREFEALALAYDPSKSNPFILRPSYEHTHASNNYAASRRYINLLDERADACFIRKTHDAYWHHLQRHFGKTIEAVFTDEPSLMAVNIGPLPEEVRKKVFVADPVDPDCIPLPSVPWSYDLPRRYEERYREDLNAQRASLFSGDREEDRRIRRQFWALIADLAADRYYGQIQTWCSQHGIASSGHTLWEEGIMHHVPLDGNKLKVLGRMDIPGLDLLSSDPEVVVHGGWMTAAPPCSAALLNHRRRVMTEVSDFSQKMGGKGPAPLDRMLATAAWQAAWGVTEFTLYYSPNDRSAADYRAYCEFVGRLNAMLKPASPNPEVLLYYPIYDLWAEYKPVAERLEGRLESPRLQKMATGFWELGMSLQRSHNPFSLVDHEVLASAQVGQGELTIADHTFTTLVLPADVELPAPTAKTVEAFRAAGGRVLTDSNENGKRLDVAALTDAIQPRERLSPSQEKIAMGRFTRDGRTVLLLVNVGTEPYDGKLSVGTGGAWLRMDPVTGSVESVNTDGQTVLPLALASRQTVLLVSP